jgi:hypothetical protein
VLYGGHGLRVFDRDKDWSEAFRDDHYGGDSYGVAFAHDGRLATTSFDGLIRLYQYDPNADSPSFHRIGDPALAPDGRNPYRIAFSPDDKRLAVGYIDVPAVDVLDGVSLKLLGGHGTDGLQTPGDGPDRVAWSADGLTLFAVGGVRDPQLGLGALLAWDRGGLGDARHLSYCADNNATGVNVLPNGRLLVGSMGPCLGLMDARGAPVWTIASPILDLRDQRDVMRLSQDGQVVDFGYMGSAGPVLRFDLRSPTLATPRLNDGLTFAANREGLAVDGWRDGFNPTLNGRALPFRNHETSRSLAIASDAKRIFVGSSFGLIAFDDAGTTKWRWQSPNDVWAVNASKDGRV